MIYVKCCGSCKYFRPDPAVDDPRIGECMSRDSWSTKTTVDDCCENWDPAEPEEEKSK